MKRAARARSLPRIELGNPLLRKKAKRVTLSYLKTKECTELLRNMLRTMRATGGVGLAAPQVGVPLRITVLETRPTETRPDLEHRGPVVVVNPRIVEFSSRMGTDYEGCLSFLGFRGRVARASSVVVEYWNAKGEPVRETANGLWARIFQHELDHLDGIVYLDRLQDAKSLMTLGEYRRRMLGKK